MGWSTWEVRGERAASGISVYGASGGLDVAESELVAVARAVVSFGVVL